MFTTMFTLDRHIEELRAELRGVADRDEADAIKSELQAMLAMQDDPTRESDAAL